ncbi:MAG: winged helix-turn-helix domain-containing protein [Pseudomonadota bacterium]|nr:winged helix-turn-helix domain-containing protein [Pseudomonadota bacterium]
MASESGEAARTGDGLTPIDLAAEPDFRLGDLLVRPSIRAVVAGGEEVRIEPRVMQVLAALAQAGGETVSRDVLVCRCWNNVTVGDDAINRAIARLRRLSAETGGAFRIETIPRVGFRLTAAPSPPAAPPSAAPPSERIEPPRAPLGRRAAYAALALTVVAATVAGIALFGGAAAFLRPAERIAVLEFAGGGETASDDFPLRIAARIRQTIGVNNLPTLARPDQQRFRGPDMPNAARDNGVGYVLDGDARLESGTMVVHAELLDARNNLSLWSREFRRSEAERDSMLDQIATHVAYVLRCALVSRRARAGLQDPQTLAVFLKACDQINLYDGGRDETLESARAVTERAPDFSPGWSMYAMAAAAASRYASPERQKELRTQARAAVARARALDRRNPETYLAEAELLPSMGAWLEKEALIAAALKLAPHDGAAHAMLGDVYLETGRMKEALAAYQRAVGADPLSPMNQTNLVPVLAALGRQEEAAAMCERLYRIWPTSPRVWMHRLHNAAFPGKVEDAARVLAGVDAAPFRMEADRVDAFRQYLAAKVSGDPEQRRYAALHYRELALAGRFDMAPAVAALAEAGELDAAFELAGPYLADPAASSWLLFSPPAKSMRRDPRLMTLAGGIGLTDYWARSGRWPDFCAAADLPYDCESEAAGRTVRKFSQAR